MGVHQLGRGMAGHISWVQLGQSFRRCQHPLLQCRSSTSELLCDLDLANCPNEWELILQINGEQTHEASRPAPSKTSTVHLF